MTAYIFYEDDAILAVRRPGGSAATIIMFADLTFRPDGLRFWGDQPAERLDLDCIGLIAKAPNWYPAASMQACARRIGKDIRSTRIGYGYSMGGYAALKWGRLFEIAQALSVSPQISIDPADLPDDRRFLRYFDPVIHSGMRIAAADLPAWSVVVGDPYDADDGQHLRGLPNDPRLNRLATPFSGHWSIWLLASTGALQAALAAIAVHDTQALRCLLKSQRGQTAFWLRQAAAHAIMHGHQRCGQTLLEQARALGLHPDLLAEAQAGAMLGRAKWLHAANRGGEARALADQALSLIPEQPQQPHHIGHQLLAMVDCRSVGFFQAALERDPDNASAAFGLSHAFKNQGEAQAALRCAEQAALLEPANPEMTGWIGHMLLEHGPAQAALAERCFRRALQLDSRLLHLHVGLIDALQAQRRFGEALTILRTLQTRMPARADWRRRAFDLRRWYWRRLWRQLTGRARRVPQAAPLLGPTMIRHLDEGDDD